MYDCFCGPLSSLKFSIFPTQEFYYRNLYRKNKYFYLYFMAWYSSSCLALAFLCVLHTLQLMSGWMGWDGMGMESLVGWLTAFVHSFVHSFICWLFFITGISAFNLKFYSMYDCVTVCVFVCNRLLLNTRTHTHTQQQQRFYGFKCS